MSRTLSKFCLHFDEATPLVHFPKALKVRGITRVLLVYINCLVCVCQCVSVSVCQCVYKRLYLADRRSQGLQILPTPKKMRTGIWRYLARNSTTLPNGGNALRHASVGVRCEMVWSATFLHRTTTSKISLESSRLAKFECEILPG